MAIPDIAAPADPVPNEEALRPIAWSETFLMGDPTIDAEHRNFIDNVNRLNAAIRDHADPAAIAAICDSLVADAAEHFASEEAVMSRQGYGGLSAHRREHLRLLTFIRGQAEQIRIAATRAEIVDGALAIKDGLLSHLFRVDIHYKTHFLEGRGR